MTLPYEEYLAMRSVLEAGQEVRYVSELEAREFWAMFKRAMEEYERLREIKPESSSRDGESGL